MDSVNDAINAAKGPPPNLQTVNPGASASGAALDLPPFVASDFSDFLLGSGAEKLADSGVAPLVAAARGYSRLDGTNFATEMRLMNVKMSTKQGKRLQRTLNGAGNDGMQMPWFSLADIQDAEKKGSRAIPFTFQVRPGRPENNEQGKPIKYEFIAGVGTPLDAHPAIPAAWIDSTPIVTIAEGLLKGDSALTAYLRKYGATWEQLNDGSDGARSRLTALLNTIPVAERVLIISIAGINNTTQNPIDWRSINLRGREAWIAFDADIESNIHVWRAAAKLWEQLETHERVDRVRLLSPKIITGTGIEKAGVDDFLAKCGTWDDLLRHMAASLPPSPAVDTREKPYKWRISQDGHSAEECLPIKDGPNGETSGYYWVPRLELGGRLSVSETRRAPTNAELRTGVFDSNVSSHEVEDSRVEVEVMWLGADGESNVATIMGPETMLNYSPFEWERKGASIPSALLRHPEWPPRNSAGDKWLSAVKSHRADEIISRTRWMQMGWVPVPGGHPVFLIGDQVIGSVPLNSTVSGVDEREINVASKFGVGEIVPTGDFDDEDYRKQVHDDLEIVLEAYVRNKPFTDKFTTALILGAALRPVIPLRPKATIFLVGPKGSGKSYGAQRMMAFWARNKGDWSEMLPGSAKDTITYIEHCVSRAPIWVADDLAPSPVKAQAEAENAKLGDLTRAIFNNTAKGRMNANMTTRKSNMPMAQLIITAENTLTTPSVKERLIPAYFGPGKLNESQEPTDHLEKIASEDGVPARLTAHLIKFVIYSAIHMDGGWSEYMNEMRERVTSTENKVATMMKALGNPAGSLKRVSTLAADVIITLELLRKLAHAVGSSRETKRLLTDHEMIKDIVEGVFVAHEENQANSVGRSTLRALRALMASGKAHVINAAAPSLPPLVDDLKDNILVNMSLGWVNNIGIEGGLKPNGICIGWVVSSPKFGAVIMLFPDVAFNAAQEAYPDMIQHGQQAKLAWSALWDEGLTPKNLKRSFSRGTPISTARINKVSGVPVAVTMIVKSDDEGTVGDDNSGEEDVERQH